MKTTFHLAKTITRIAETQQETKLEDWTFYVSSGVNELEHASILSLCHGIFTH